MIDYDGLRWIAMGFTEFYWVFRVSGLGYEGLRWVAMGFRVNGKRAVDDRHRDRDIERESLR